jgi:hypothetical protein
VTATPVTAAADLFAARDADRFAIAHTARYAPPGRRQDPYAYLDGSVFDALR